MAFKALFAQQTHSLFAWLPARHSGGSVNCGPQRLQGHAGGQHGPGLSIVACHDHVGLGKIYNNFQVQSC